MLIAIGTLLVLLTWIVAAAAIGCLGLALAVLLRPKAHAHDLLRTALWLGLGVTSVIVTLLGLGVPLSSPVVAITVVLVAAISVALVWRSLIRRTGWRAKPARRWWPLLLALVAAQVLLAVAALGPVTNYDSGLYHLGAIAYGRDFAAIPGLANLYGPLGYSTLEFVWGSAFSSGPWGAEGFRLLNGLLMLLVLLDLALRLTGPRRRPGDFVLAAGVIVAWLPMIAMADYWVTSPTQDSAVLVLTVAASAYLADAVADRPSWRANAAVALVICAVLVAVRTTMIVYAAGVLLVVVALAIRRRGTPRQGRGAWAITAMIAVVLGVGMVARDYVLSGWLQYPLSVLPFDVPWRAADPAVLREATLAFWRDRGNPAGALEGWSWVGPWIARLPEQWEPFYVALLLLAAIAALIAAHRTGRVPWRAIGATVAPAALATVVWWLTSPPGFRFIWGPLFTVFAGVIGWSVWVVASRDRRGANPAPWMLAVAAIPLAMVVGVTVAARMPWWDQARQAEWSLGVSVPYARVPVPEAATVPQQSASGLETRRPVVTDQCWATYPMCSPSAPVGLSLRGESLQNGFVGQRTQMGD